MSSISTHIVMSTDVNGQDRLFGGQLMAWIDIIGAVEARRWSGQNVTTITVDNLTFLEPAWKNDTIVLEATLTWTGKTSMEVRVLTYVEDVRDGVRKLINKAYLVYVAINDYGEPLLISPFHPSTDEENFEWSAALARKKIRTGK